MCDQSSCSDNKDFLNSFLISALVPGRESGLKLYSSSQITKIREDDFFLIK